MTIAEDTTALAELASQSAITVKRKSPTTRHPWLHQRDQQHGRQ
ncbi:MAG: hypothetical protein ACJAR2_000826 [Ilumatobacter sp.]|jgi:hypothetical protein